MMFVTVGTHEQDFDRLIKSVDEYAYKKGFSKNQIFIQIGYSNYSPKYCSFKKMVSYQEMKELYKEADLVITHGGPGSMFIPWRLGKKVIGVPRQQQFDEHVDDHQVYFCELMESEGKIICVKDITKLERVIDKLLNNTGSEAMYSPKTGAFVKEFRSKIEELIGSSN